jgi:hypothetical protein
MPCEIEDEVLDRLDVGDDTIDVIERWLAAELERHATRTEKIGWREPGKRRRVSSEQLERLFSAAMRDLAPIVEALRRLGFTVPETSIEGAIYAVGRGDASAGKAAVEVMRSMHAETHATLTRGN